MQKSKIILTGSEGLIGKKMHQVLQKKHDVIPLDLELGHDLTNETFVNSFFKENPADYLVNLHAINDHADSVQTKPTLFDISLESFQDYMNINVTSLFSVCRAFAKQDLAKGIINFSSIYGVVSPVPELYDGEKHIGYAVSKGAVIQLSRYLATHLAPKIRVNCVVPGGVENDQPQNFKTKYENRTPMKRMMKTDELNGLIDYLCSDQSSYMTGSTLTIDGGWTTV